MFSLFVFIYLIVFHVNEGPEYEVDDDDLVEHPDFVDGFDVHADASDANADSGEDAMEVDNNVCIFYIFLLLSMT